MCRGDNPDGAEGVDDEEQGCRIENGLPDPDGGCSFKAHEAVAVKRPIQPAGSEAAAADLHMGKDVGAGDPGGILEIFRVVPFPFDGFDIRGVLVDVLIRPCHRVTETPSHVDVVDVALRPEGLREAEFQKFFTRFDFLECLVDRFSFHRSAFLVSYFWFLLGVFPRLLRPLIGCDPVGGFFVASSPVVSCALVVLVPEYGGAEIGL